MPAPVIYNAIVRALKDPDVMKRLSNEGAIAVADPPDAFYKFVREEIAT